MATSGTNQRVRDVIVKTFKLGGEDGEGELRMGGVPGWDSLGHMQLVVELEEEFGASWTQGSHQATIDVKNIPFIAKPFLHALQLGPTSLDVMVFENDVTNAL